MYLSTATVLVLGALQPVLGSPAPQRVPTDGSQNVIISDWLTATKTVINYHAPDPKCGGHRPWVGMWPADACNPYAADFKAWAYVKKTQGFDDIATVEFDNAQLGPGEFKAAFVCEDGKRQPWMLSKTFKIDEAPPSEPGQCVHRQSDQKTTWTYTACDRVKSDLCFDCVFGLTCIACSDCEEQCGLQSG
ncbi:hypothetical protein MGU_08756 [Metarhizium guizhouense ARSEF 977]|uniref:Uncharacterized protein n=1 Tax=Metarhizium guizhouense (strain ARSEF 977) TaxID=1276136 RepID=A0A0B4GAY7_METGA|nr:hypothetical protein MGU_08756 [Metarhizium guizhouense ARSEF 977]